MLLHAHQALSCSVAALRPGVGCAAGPTAAWTGVETFVAHDAAALPPLHKHTALAWQVSHTSSATQVLAALPDDGSLERFRTEYEKLFKSVRTAHGAPLVVEPMGQHAPSPDSESL